MQPPPYFRAYCTGDRVDWPVQIELINTVSSAIRQPKKLLLICHDICHGRANEEEFASASALVAALDLWASEC